MVAKRTNYRIGVYCYMQNAGQIDECLLARSCLLRKEKIQLLGMSLNDICLGQ